MPADCRTPPHSTMQQLRTACTGATMLKDALAQALAHSGSTGMSMSTWYDYYKLTL